MEFILKLTQDEIQIIAQGLGELPLKFSGPIMVKLQKQVTEQDVPIPISQIGEQVGEFVPNTNEKS